MNFDTIRSREAASFLPVFRRHPVALVEGSGSRVVDVEGREYIDLMAGWAVTSIGHCHPALVEALRDQAGRLMQVSNLFYTVPQTELLERLDAVTPEAITRTFLVNSGTEATEGALKVAHRATGRSRFVSTENSFHGRTLGALSVIGQESHREPYAALLPPEPRVIPYDDLGAARAAIDDETAAIIVEPVQGEGGVNVPADGYLRGLREICDRSGALLILDEVQTGVGRTGKFLGLEHEGVRPDVVTLGKALGGGFPVAAFLTSEDVAKTARPGDHGSTFGGNLLACAAANAVLRVVDEEDLAARAAELGGRLRERLEAFAREREDLVAEVRGLGLIQGLVLRDAERASALAGRALERGVLVNVTAGRVVRFMPALNIPEADLWEGVDRVLAIAAGS